MVQKKKEKRRKRKRKGRKKNLRRMRKKHESSKSVGSRSHQPYSPFVFHARRPRVLFLLQSRDHEGMVLDMHPPGIIRGPPFVETIRPVINPGKFVNSRTQENDATVKDHHHSHLLPLPSLCLEMILWVMSWVTVNHSRHNHSLYYPWQIWWLTLFEG